MAFWLWSWLTGRRQRPEMRVIVFTRKDCPLCDEAWELLTEQRKRWGFVLEAVDIDGDAELVREHGEWVPVVVIDGQVRFRGHVNVVLLERLMRAQCR